MAIATSVHTRIAPPSPLASALIPLGRCAYHVAAGFDTGFSLFYSSPFDSGTVYVMDGLYGGGNFLAALNLPATLLMARPTQLERSAHLFLCFEGAGFAGHRTFRRKPSAAHREKKQCEEIAQSSTLGAPS